MAADVSIRCRLYEQVGMCKLVEALDDMRHGANLLVSGRERFVAAASEMLDADEEALGAIVSDAFEAMEATFSRIQDTSGS